MCCAGSLLCYLGLPKMLLNAFCVCCYAFSHLLIFSNYQGHSGSGAYFRNTEHKGSGPPDHLRGFALPLYPLSCYHVFHFAIISDAGHILEDNTYIIKGLW